MTILSRLRLRSKLALLVGLSALAVVVSTSAAGVLIRQRMFDDRVAVLRAIVQSTISIAQSLENRVIAHTLTREQALAMLRDDVHALRFNDGMGYAYAQTLDNIIVLHGAAPALEGKPLPPPYKNTTPLTELIRETLRSSNGGVVNYVFLRPGQTEPVQKVTYVERFAPWDLVFGAGDYVDDLDAAFHAAVLKLGLFGGATLAVATLVAWLVNRDIAISLGALKVAMERLAKGDLATVIPATERRDEFGAMAGAVLVFKEHMVQGEHLAAAREDDSRRSMAEKQAALIGMADTIEAETTTALQEVAARTNAMTATAEEMSASAARTGNSAHSAAIASAQALATAQTVASAAEQLSASIREIGGQMARSTEIVGRAVAAGAEARATIDALNEQVGRIGAVADMIGAIAGKTNLLALNATIEAARAGDAGKGFAVVASEVKALATQTARSTQEIAQHISEVRSATGVSVAAVVRIEQTIGEMNAIAGSIAAAVEEQGAATAEIARNVAETASAATNMTDRTEEVSTEAEQTGKHAADVRENAAALNTAVGDLRHSVIRVVRTSTTEVDRRKAVRHQVDLSCRLSVPGHAAASARVTDISEGGAAVRGGPLLPLGTRGTLHLDSVGLALPCTVRGSENDALRLVFELDDATATKFRPIVERLAPSLAA